MVTQPGALVAEKKLSKNVARMYSRPAILNCPPEGSCVSLALDQKNRVHTTRTNNKRRMHVEVDNGRILGTAFADNSGGRNFKKMHF